MTGVIKPQSSLLYSMAGWVALCSHERRRRLPELERDGTSDA